MKLRFFGYMLGWSFITIGALNLDLPTAFWNRLCGGPSYVYSLDDVTSQDAHLANFLRSVQQAAQENTAEEFEETFNGYAFVLAETGADDQTI